MKKLAILATLLIATSSGQVLSKDTKKATESKPATKTTVKKKRTKNLNITEVELNDIKKLKKFILENKPKTVFIEQRYISQDEKQKILKDLKKVTNKNDGKLILVTGENTWIGLKGLQNTHKVLHKYKDNIDGIALRAFPNRLNIWKKDNYAIHAELLNKMLDTYSAMKHETMANKKIFLAEYPFWYGDYRGPKGSFSEDACKYSDGIVFFTENTDKLEEVEFDWTNVSCNYYVSLAKRPLKIDSKKIPAIKDIIKLSQKHKPGFQGYIYDVEDTQ